MPYGFSESSYFGMLTEPPVSRTGSGGALIVWFKLLVTQRFVEDTGPVSEHQVLYCRCTGTLAKLVAKRQPREMFLVTGRIRPSLLKRTLPNLPIDVSDVRVLCRPNLTPPQGKLP